MSNYYSVLVINQVAIPILCDTTSLNAYNKTAYQ